MSLFIVARNDCYFIFIVFYDIHVLVCVGVHCFPRVIILLHCGAWYTTILKERVGSILYVSLDIVVN